MSCNCDIPQQSSPNYGNANVMPSVDYAKIIYQEPVVRVPSQEPLTSIVVNDNRPWVDNYLLNNFQYGYRAIDKHSGILKLSLIPQWLINSVPDQTQDSSNGYPVGHPICLPNSNGNWQQYVKIQGTTAYQYIKNTVTGEEKEGGNWDFGIKDQAITSVDGGKVINLSNLFSRVAKPLSDFLDIKTGSLATGYTVIPVVYTKLDNQPTTSTRIQALINNKDVQAAVLPSLTTQKGKLWDYNKVTNISTFKPENLDGLVNIALDGTTLRGALLGQAGQQGTSFAGASQRPGGLVATAYTYADQTSILGSGTPSDPLKLATASGGLQEAYVLTSEETVASGSDITIPSNGSQVLIKSDTITLLDAKTLTYNITFDIYALDADNGSLGIMDCYLYNNGSIVHALPTWSQKIATSQFTGEQLITLTTKFLAIKGENNLQFKVKVGNVGGSAERDYRSSERDVTISWLTFSASSLAQTVEYYKTPDNSKLIRITKALDSTKDSVSNLGYTLINQQDYNNLRFNYT